MQYKLEITQEARDVLSQMDRLPQRILEQIAHAYDDQNPITVSQIQLRYLSFPSDGPVVDIGCRHISGRLRGSLRNSQAVIRGQSVESSIGSNVVYAGAQEFGFEGPEEVRAHNRKSKKGDDIGVRSYTREMRLTGRRFIQRGIEDREADYTRAISDALVNAWKST